ncbi:MAG: RagB/SusD family nutrient uptake outer membrane protein [Bacteroidales bacterium]|nr:RagB/SusD family nutrient uptake outer membrane protein [Bacteroidales bacterium]
MKRYEFLIAGMLTLAVGCNYLDVVPETKAKFEDCFKSQSECQKFKYYMYQSMPCPGSHYATPDFLAGDDFISGRKGTVSYFQYKSVLYGIESPNQSYWGFWWSGNIPELGSRRTTLDIYESIRHCYMMLDNIDKVPDITTENYNTWRGEAYFLIAYYHNVLFDYYGPCVLIRKQLTTDAPDSELFPARSTADECVDFICSMYDKALELLPPKRIDAELNFASGAAAIGLKARLLITAASPLYNGNTAMSAFQNHDGEHLIAQEYDAQKWKRALDACEAAIEYCENNGYILYDHPDANIKDDFERAVSNYHDVFCANHHNPEEYLFAYGGLYTSEVNIRHSAPRSENPNGTGGYYADGFRGYFSPTFEAAEMYYTKNGLPWDKDPETKNLNPYEYDPSTQTAIMHSHREPRFYANVGYDRGTYEINGTVETIYARGGEIHGSTFNIEDECQNCTGYFNKKFVNKENYFDPASKTFKYFHYNYPIIRLAELYLSYAEADFEYNGQLSEKGYACLDKVRKRAGLPDFRTSWAMAGGVPQGNDLREIIRRERSIEQFCESRRYHDLRRWMTAQDVMTRKPKAWNLDGTTAESFYQVKEMPELMDRVWKSYWLAIPIQEMNVNTNLVQNPGY